VIEENNTIISPRHLLTKEFIKKLYFPPTNMSKGHEPPRKKLVLKFSQKTRLKAVKDRKKTLRNWFAKPF
jgi:hypothetical protein